MLLIVKSLLILKKAIKILKNTRSKSHPDLLDSINSLKTVEKSCNKNDEISP